MWSIYLLYIVNVLFFLGFCVLAWKKPGLALILLPFAMAGMFFSTIVFDGAPAQIEDAELGVVAAAIFLFPVTIFLIWWTPSVNPQERPWYKTVALIIVTIIEYLILLGVLTLVFNVLGPVLFVFLVVATVRYKLSTSYSLAMDILSAIGMSMRQSLPLPMALNTAAHGQDARRQRIFKEIASWLTQGLPLSESIRRGYRKCPPELLASIAAAEKMDQLPSAIETLQADMAEKANDYKRIRPVHPWYPLIIFVIAFFIALGMSIFIMPTFSEVISDMSDGQAELPASTQTLIDFSRFITGNRGFNAVVITLVVLTAVICYVSGKFIARDPARKSRFSRLKDWLKWHLPILHWFERTWSQLQLTEMLKVGLRAGYPVNIALRNALDLDVNDCFRNRMHDWLHRMEQGESIPGSAVDAGFDRTIAWAFDESVNKGNTPQILETLENIYRSRYNHRINLVNAIGCPLMVLGLGICIGWVVYAFFMGAFHTLFVTIQYAVPGSAG